MPYTNSMHSSMSSSTASSRVASCQINYNEEPRFHAIVGIHIVVGLHQQYSSSRVQTTGKRAEQGDCKQELKRDRAAQKNRGIMYHKHMKEKRVKRGKII